MDIQNVGFLAKSLTLASPKREDLIKAYNSLSGRGSITITCAPVELAETLVAAEEAGFFGMRVDGTTITAHKGKEGPCYDTGRTARYLGSAAAAMDDDHHLLSGKLRVCEKTARLYGSEAYRGCIEVSEPDPALLARLDKDPAPFNCDTFETDAKALAASMKARLNAAVHAVFYPGPFKLLILADGTIIRRGRCLFVSPDQASELKERDGAWLNSPNLLPGSVEVPENYLELHRKDGAACLLDEVSLVARPPRKTDFDALDELPQEMKRRLQTLISRGEEYFILTGSDPAQKDGCCPSNDVGIANRLVEAGILDSRGAGANSDCPVTLYAFASEIRPSTDKPVFVRNEALRAAVRDRFEKGPRFSRKVAFRLALLAVMAAAAIILGVVLYRQIRGG